MHGPSTTCLFPPTWLADQRQYFGRYLVDGVVVELSTVEGQTDSDAIECVGRGPWEHFDLVACGPHQVPTIATELRLLSELVRQRRSRSLTLSPRTVRASSRTCCCRLGSKRGRGDAEARPQ
jgi:hypothetical protein